MLSQDVVSLLAFIGSIAGILGTVLAIGSIINDGRRFRILRKRQSDMESEYKHSQDIQVQWAIKEMQAREAEMQTRKKYREDNQN